MEHRSSDASLRGQPVALSPVTLQALLRECACCYRAGRLTEAEHVCRQVLASEIAHYRRALDLQPDIAQAHNNLGNVLVNVGKQE
jgi:Flp pilus assembly protein TadD